MKKVLITGFSGLLGSNLAFEFKDRYAIVGQYNRHRPGIKGVGLLQCDLSSDFIRKVLDVRPEVIIHTAALTNVDYCEEHPEETYDINSRSAGDLAKAASSMGAKIVFISTDSVYRDTPGKAYKEMSSPLDPLNVYSKSKLRGEEMVSGACEDYLIIRTTIYGYNYQDKLSLGEWVLYNLGNGKPIKMFDDVFFNPILVNDLASAIYVLIEKDLSGVFNVDSRGSISKYGFGVKIAERFDLDPGLISPVSVSDHDFTAKRPRNMVSDVSRILEYADVPTIAQGIEHFRDLYMQEYPQRLKRGV
ncbi:MAG: SDR family oxidoreductase [Candidatus Omnitrophota bacterium]